jgi:hypothetical protein
MQHGCLVKAFPLRALIGMSRVELTTEEPAPREADRRREPEKAEGDEETIDEALRRQEQPRPED